MTFNNGLAVKSSRTAVVKETRQNALFYSIIFLAILFLFYGSLYTLWMVNPVLYHEIIRVLIVGLPGDAPFADTTGWLSWFECRARGVNILFSNPCDPLNDVTLTYSPLFLDFPTWFRLSDSQPLGLAQASAFLFTLPFLFRPSSLNELCVACFAAFSTSVIFAVERANMDILIFTLLALAVLIRRSSVALRFFPYAIFIAGGMLKFYPLVLLSTSLRERPRTFFAIAAISAALISGVVVVHWNDLKIILRSLPPLIVWGDTFGARELPLGMAYFFRNSIVPFLSIEIVCVACLCLAVWVFLQLRNEENALEAADCRSEFLILGSILIVGCFFSSGENAGYRAIFLLFLLPGLRETAAGISAPRLKSILSVSQISILLLLWKDCLRQGIDVLFRPTGNEHGLAELPYLLFFVLRELNWWFVVAVASAIAALFFSRAPTFRWSLSLLHREPKPLGT